MSGEIVTGNTYPHRDALKALGGKWDPQAKGWRFDDPAKAEQARKIVGPATAMQRPARGGYRPHGAAGICTKCGDDCGGTAWSCNYE